MRSFFAVIAALFALYEDTAKAAPNKTACYAFPVVGYGVVAGLAQNGDDFRQSPFTAQLLKNLFSAVGVHDFNPQAFDRNVAAALVSGMASGCPLPSGGRVFTAPSKMDLKVSPVGNARSLIGGVLLTTRINGADGKLFALGQGVLEKCPLLPPHGRFNPPMCITGGGIVFNPEPTGTEKEMRLVFRH